MSASFPETCEGMLEYRDGTFRCLALGVRLGDDRGRRLTDEEATALCRECRVSKDNTGEVTW